MRTFTRADGHGAGGESKHGKDNTVTRGRGDSRLESTVDTRDCLLNGSAAATAVHASGSVVPGAQVAPSSPCEMTGA